MRKIISFAMVCSVAACDAEGNLGEEGSLLWYKRTSIEEQIAYFKPNRLLKKAGLDAVSRT